MKVSNYKTLILFIFFAGIFSNVFSEEIEATKDIHKEFQVSDQTQLDISNMFGNVTIVDWEKMELIVDIKISTFANNEEKANKMLEYINVDISESDNVIKFLTVIGEKLKSKKIIVKNNERRTNQDYQIDYTVKMPRNLKLDLLNKYGDIFINEIHGKSNITSKFGTLKAKKLLFDDSKPLSKITVSYGDCLIEKTNWMTLISNFSDAEIEEGQALIVVSKYSEIKVSKSNSIVCESKFDEYHLGAINNLIATVRYTEFDVDRIGRKAEIDMKYGNVDIHHVPAEFELIKIDSEYSEIDIEIAENASYNLEAEAKYGEISFPQKANIETHNTMFTQNIKGYIGSAESTNSSVNITCSFGNVDLD